jgi:hypothetical protein
MNIKVNWWIVTPTVIMIIIIVVLLLWESPTSISPIDQQILQR